MNKRMLSGIGCGALATIAMSTVHFLARKAGVFPVWEPVPLAVAIRIFGSRIGRPQIVVLAIALHLAYGGFWGGLLGAMTRRATVWKGIGMGVFLWGVMQLGVFPFLGWGIFASRIGAETAAIPAATLVEHLVYGATLGWLGARSALAPSARP